MADMVRRRILPPDDEEKVRIRAARREARQSAERLRALPFREQMALVEQEEGLQSWALAELLCDESVQAVADGQAPKALQLAKVALRIAGLAREEQSWRTRLESYVWSHLGNAQRALGELREAEETFRHAESLWLEGAVSHPGPLDSARSLRLESLLRKAQRRLKEGLDLLDRAQTIASPAEELVIRIQKGAFLGISDRWNDAVRELLRAGSSLDARHPSHLPSRLRLDFAFNLLVSLIHSGRPSEAEKTLVEARKLAATHGTDVDRTRVRWQEARIAAGLQRTDQALTAFGAARSALADHGLPYDAALATFELAALHAEQGHAAAAKELARELAPLTTSEGVPRESQATIKLFCRMIEKDGLNPERVRRFAEDFLRTAGDPSLRPEIWVFRED